MSQRILGIFVAVLAVIGGAVLGNSLLRPAPEPPEPPEISGIYLPQARTLPEFELIHQTGRSLTNADLTGYWTFVYFGYTYCPDACPLTLAQLNVVDHQLKQRQAAQKVNYLLISVDPQRDTPERLAEYTAFFNPQFQGATGEEEQLAQLAQAIGVFYRVPENPEDPERYLVDHSSTVLVINPDGALQAIFTPPQHADTMSAEFDLIRDHYYAYH